MITTTHTSQTYHVPYYNEVLRLNRNDKMRLINLLSVSLLEDMDEVAEKKNTLNACFNSWQADGYSSKDLIDDINNMCAENNDFIKELL